jgi:hypothetical protein
MTHLPKPISELFDPIYALVWAGDYNGHDLTEQYEEWFEAFDNAYCTDLDHLRFSDKDGDAEQLNRIQCDRIATVLEAIAQHIRSMS